jgi:hypothetical protein
MHHVAADATLVFLIGAPRRGTLIDLTWGPVAIASAAACASIQYIVNAVTAAISKAQAGGGSAKDVASGDRAFHLRPVGG